MSKHCNQQPETCQLSYKGNQCKLLNFELAPENLAFDKCENFPKLLEKYISCVGLDVFKQIASIAAGATELDLDPYNLALQKYFAIGKFNFCGNSYNIRAIINDTSGALIFDSQRAFSTLAPTNVNTGPATGRMEVQDASETQWGAQRRGSLTFGGVTYKLYAAWLAGVSLSARSTANRQTDPCDRNLEVVCVRLLLTVDSCGNFIPGRENLSSNPVV